MTLVLLTEGQGRPRIVRRVPEGAARREDALRDLLFAHPAMLPVSEIDPGMGLLVPIARELNVPDVGRIDAFLMDARGHLVIVECKLWRNPQARREVVGQITHRTVLLRAVQAVVCGVRPRPGRERPEVAAGHARYQL